jgi:DNA polymerase-3 subunit gamma/tau
LDQAIAFGGGEVRDADVRVMLGVVAGERLPSLLEAVAAGDARSVMMQIDDLAAHAPDFASLLRDLLTLLHRIAVLQQVPEGAQASWGDVDALRLLAARLPPEDVQLWYQIALLGQRDLALAPDARSGFEMVLLRMLAFLPAAADNEPGNAQGRAQAGGAGETPPTPAGTAAREPASRPQAGHSAPAQAAQAPRFSDWHAFVAGLGLKGMTAQLADNCAFAGWDGKTLELKLDPSCERLKDSVAGQRLREAIERASGQALQLRIDVAPGPDATETPAQRQARERAARQRATEEDIAQDPVVLAMQETFDAEIVPNSIRRIEPTNREG